MKFDDVIHNYAAGHFDRDEALHYLRTEGYPAERAEAILMGCEHEKRKILALLLQNIDLFRKIPSMSDNVARPWFGPSDQV